MGKEREDAALPLLPIYHPPEEEEGGEDTSWNGNFHFNHDGQQIQFEETSDDGTIVKMPKTKRRTSLLVFDLILLLLDYLQFFALLMAMSEHWTWPETWLRHLSFVFLFNLDVWEFTKFSTGVYVSAKSYFLPSAVVFDVHFLLLAWLMLCTVLVVSYTIFYAVLLYKQNASMLLRIAQLQRVYLTIAQVIALPLGTTLAKLFHCTYLDAVDVYNGYTCFSGTHWGLVAGAVAMSLLFFVGIAAWMIIKIRRQMFSSHSDRHEGYLQLKEAQFIRSIDVVWAVGHFHLFSSYKRFWVYYRPVLFLFKFAIVCFYAGLIRHPLAQIWCILVCWLVFLVVGCIWRPFRVTSFNFMFIMNFVCLLANSFVGCALNMPSLTSVWLTPDYLFYELLLINGVWCLAVVLWLLFLLMRRCGCLWKGYPLWPSMTEHGMDKLSTTTRHYIKAILDGRQLLERSLSMPALFSPAHELSRQIQIINAYCREAEYLRDPFHDTLWDLLDELIEAHTRIAPISLFAESVKPSIQQTAQELMKVMPQFTKRMVQRDYDFILMTPLKRRMLLKMYCIGVFVNGRAERVNQERDEAGLYKVWHRSPTPDLSGDDGYFEEPSDDPDNTHKHVMFREPPPTASATWSNSSSLLLEPDMFPTPDGEGTSRASRPPPREDTNSLSSSTLNSAAGRDNAAFMPESGSLPSLADTEEKQETAGHSSPDLTAPGEDDQIGGTANNQAEKGGDGKSPQITPKPDHLETIAEDEETQ
ncbi:PREDICTED: uncharacterized protein LOC109480348 [Branchiostoma belcheri]|uniref:Uncharacterized protein LOC109480348 n=1 Tax=Branchiostoma belcheri TaxID=7741 RepID=A0A6P5A8N4_BRABE|nr:PREDICTED: uncharacterized protein LOC109480348 [Branchiostoma belcheri]